MNNVIWLMYLADVVGSISVLLSVSGVLTLMGCGGYLAGAAISNSDSYGDDKLPLMSAVKGYAIAALIALGAACVLPSQTTIYATAAVTAGEQALNTPTGDKAVRALNAWLDKQIASAGEEKK